MSRNEFGLDWDSRVSESKDNRTREQTIVWRNDFENINYSPSAVKGFYHSKRCIVLVDSEMMVGQFSKFYADQDPYFDTVGRAFFSAEVIKEFAFLE